MSCRISTMIFTLDEEINLPHCLGSLDWCDDVIVIDSGSSDQTVEIAEQAGVRVFVNPFEGFGTQRNWAIDNTSPRHEWVLVLDADERVPDALVEEMHQLIDQQPELGAARLRRRFTMWGKWLRYSSLYPVWVVRLVHRDRARYINRGHAETQEIEGDIVALHSDLIDENHKGMDAWFERQERYSLADARYELEQAGESVQFGNLFSSDPLARKMTLKRIAWRLPFRSFIYFVYSYVFRQGFRDGRLGFRFCRLKAGYQKSILRHKKQLKRQMSAEAPTGND